ncbi:MAG: CPBP family intramembrane glutamic endopeptidase [Isosphaeraceae bacterium]
MIVGRPGLLNKQTDMNMQTAIGRGLLGGRLVAAGVLGLVSIGLDLGLLWWNHYPESVEGRWAIGFVVMATYVWLADGDLPSLGFCPPEGGWLRWMRLAVWIGVLAGASVGAGVGCWLALGWKLPVGSVAPGEIGSAFFRMCLAAPLLEEGLYRFALCIPLVRWLGLWRTVAVSGVVFGVLHAFYGNVSPENALGGFFLAWAFLRSGSIVVPVALHAAGNLLVLAGQVGVCYLGSRVV